MNPLAQEGFARGAEAYARGRPSYPLAGVAWASKELGLGQGSVVLDLAAGTGKLTALLTGFAKLVAVEPVAEMRAELAKLPGVEVREGTAEALPARDAEFDAVFIAQAFHWFPTHTVLAELHRVLRPGGGLCLLWNRWDRRVPWADAVKAITAPYDAKRPRYESHEWKAAFEGQAFFEPLKMAEYANPHRLPRADVATRMAAIRN